MYIKFYKEEDGRWYAFLPQFQVSKEQCEMVCGADVMLDIVAQGQTNIELYFSEKNPELDCNQINLIKEGSDNEGGGYYLLSKYNDIPFDLELWLCDVTKLVFGYLPKTIYFK